MPNILDVLKPELEKLFADYFGPKDPLTIVECDRAQLGDDFHFFGKSFLSDDRAEHVEFEQHARMEFGSRVLECATTLRDQGNSFNVYCPPKLDESTGVRSIVLDTAIPIRLILHYSGAHLLYYERDDDGECILDHEGEKVGVYDSGHVFTVDYFASPIVAEPDVYDPWSENDE